MTTTAPTRYRVEPDLDSNPVDMWASQSFLHEDMTPEELDDWLDPDRWQSFMVTEQRLCWFCEQWEDGDTIGAFDYHDSMDVETPNVGIYSLHELHEDMADHFKEA